MQVAGVIKLGVVFGERLSLALPIRSSTSEVPGDPVLRFGDRQVSIDSRLSADLARMLPKCFAHAPASEWRAFVVLAVAKGVL